MRLNLWKRKSKRERTFEGAPAAVLTLEQQLRRSVLSCMLWESEFYEQGETIAARIKTLAAEIEPEVVARLAIEARIEMKLRHAPLLLLTVLAKTGAGREKLVASTVAEVLQRADEPAELLALYWQDGKKPLPAQFKKGLSRALAKFDAYELGKYDRPGAVRLRDVLFLVHAKPSGEAQTATWKALADDELASPDTWEVALSAGADKRATFERLLGEKKLGYLALLRNLRNMSEAGVDEALVRQAILARRGAQRVLPFRFVAAARAAPRFDQALDEALRASIAAEPALPGKTIVLVDVSGSMQMKLSRRSDLSRMDAAAALASIVKGNVRVFTFSEDVREVPARPGLAGIDAIVGAQPAGGTRLGKAVEAINRLPHDRLIVVTDEQSHDAVPGPVAKRAYMINVASAKNGVGYGQWTRLDGFSEQVLRWIATSERA
ncbi:MAG: TROVE domain-containing protein [Proteobacteria bacterium]|nr:TROVE domain-containing protein [Pseudomonadota bacterium]